MKRGENHPMGAHGGMCMPRGSAQGYAYAPWEKSLTHAIRSGHMQANMSLSSDSITIPLGFFLLHCSKLLLGSF